MRFLTRALLLALAVALAPSLAVAEPISYHGIHFDGKVLGTVNATIGITPIEDSASGFGRIYDRYALNGIFNGSVFWIGEDDVSGQPFAVVGHQITFRRGSYTHYSGGVLNETLNIYAADGLDVFLINHGQLAFALPHTVTPVVSPDANSDSYRIDNVSMLVSRVPPLPKLRTGLLLCFGILAVLVWVSVFAGPRVETGVERRSLL
jgi:hypothetical protein